MYQATYWKTLEEFPTMSGLFVEQSRAEVQGNQLYEGQPLRRSKFHILSGRKKKGWHAIGEDRGKKPSIIYLKYELLANSWASRPDVRLAP